MLGDGKTHGSTSDGMIGLTIHLAIHILGFQVHDAPIFEVLVQVQSKPGHFIEDPGRVISENELSKISLG